MSVNVEVVRTGNENNTSLLRRFTKRVQGSGVLPRVRSERYAARKPSEYVKKKHALKKINRKSEIQTLIKKGLMTEGLTKRSRR